jgi:DNA polymerase-3 subunit epsilon
LFFSFEWYELPVPPFKYFCTLKLAHAAWPGLESHALASLGEHFGIDYDARHALADAQTCGIIARKAAETYACTRLGKLLRAAGLEMEAL